EALMFRRSIILSAVVMLVGALFAAAQTTPSLHVLASNGMKAVINDLRPQLEREVGRPLAFEFSTSTAIRQRIESGDAFDVAILTNEVLRDLAQAGKITSNSIIDLGRSGIGFAVRAG